MLEKLTEPNFVLKFIFVLQLCTQVLSVQLPLVIYFLIFP